MKDTQEMRCTRLSILMDMDCGLGQSPLPRGGTFGVTDVRILHVTWEK